MEPLNTDSGTASAPDRSVTAPDTRDVRRRRGLCAALIIIMATVVAVRWGTRHGQPPTLDMWRSLVLDIGACVLLLTLLARARSHAQTACAVAGAMIAAASLLVGRL